MGFVGYTSILVCFSIYGLVCLFRTLSEFLLLLQLIKAESQLSDIQYTFATNAIQISIDQNKNLVNCNYL